MSIERPRLFINVNKETSNRLDFSEFKLYKIIFPPKNATISISWLSGLIESSIDCLDIMPIQCICEFVWNIFSGPNEASVKVF